MSRRVERHGSRRRALLVAGCAVLLLVAGLWWTGISSGVGEPPPLVAQPDLGGGAGLTLIGISSVEEADELWAIGPQAIVRRAGDDWSTLELPGGGGGPGSRFAPASGPQAGRVTAHGSVAILGQIGGGSDSRQVLAIRDPGASPRLAPDPDPAVLRTGESLYATGAGRGPLVAAVDEADGVAGAFVAPATNGTATGVLRFDGRGWGREPICVGPTASPCAPPAVGLAVLAVAAVSPRNAWLLAQTTSDGVVLFSRDADAGIWRQRSLGTSPFARRTVTTAPGVTATIAPRATGQPLAVMDGGVWVDAHVSVAGTETDATLFFRPDAAGGGSVVASWCDPGPDAPDLCAHPLGSDLPTAGGRSFAWNEGGEYGSRVITGLRTGVVLRLEGDAFTRLPTVGGDAGASLGAAFSASDDGWLGSAGGPVRLDRVREPNRLAAWPVPFRRPLTAIAAQPGAAVASLDSEALTVGDRGEVARFRPGSGWQPEFLLGATGARATPRLRAVAWPEPGRAHAVGDDAAMWLWRKQTGLWEPDPAQSPNLLHANFTGIAFDPADPDRGYAVGKQGVLLRYDRQWTPERLPDRVDPQVNFTSIAFAGRQALVTYQLPEDRSQGFSGGLLVNDGSGWRVDAAAAAALGGVAPARVAGLPDGGAVIASHSGIVAARYAPTAEWQTVPQSAGGYPVALAAFREDGHVRALLSVEGVVVGTAITQWNIDSDQIFNPSPTGQGPLLTDPYPLPLSGFLLRQTAGGWRDEQRQAFPVSDERQATAYDWPVRPDTIAALLASPDGGQVWAVGGETGAAAGVGSDPSTVQTAGVMRYPADGSVPGGAASAPVVPTAGQATLAFGGNAQCASACADLVNVDPGPERWLPAAVGMVTGMSGVRAFVHTGPGVADGLAAKLGASAFARETDAYANRLTAAAGALPVFAAPGPSDRDSDGSLATFANSFAGAGQPLGGAPPGRGITPLSSSGPTQGYYAFASAGSEGVVRVVVLDYSAASLGDDQRCWLANQLSAAAAAGAPAIVVGNRDLSSGHSATNVAADAATVVPIVVSGTPPRGCALSGPQAGASAYFFDLPQENRTYPLSSGNRSIPSFGSGTLGYVSPPVGLRRDFAGASGLLLAAVDVARTDPATNVAPVTVRLVASIADLAIDATDGTFLRRSQPALFEGLARRPRGGMKCIGHGLNCSFAPDPYVEIPSRCQGATCASGIFPEYEFSSSKPDIADFVKADPASRGTHTVLLGADDKPVADASSGLLCAYNAGTTDVTIRAGGLSYTLPVTVRPGSVQRPCGTVPLRNPPQRPIQVQPTAPPPPGGPAPDPGFAGGSTPLPPPPPPVPVAATTPVSPLVPLPFVALPLGAAQLPPLIVPPPVPAAPTTPPSGTSPVTQPVSAPESQRDEEPAVDLVHNMAAYRPGQRTAVPLYVPGLILLAAVAGGGLRGVRRRGRLAYADAHDRPRAARPPVHDPWRSRS